MNGLLLAARLILAAVFFVAAFAKLADRAGTRAAVEGFGVRSPLAGPVAALLPFAELAAATALIPSATARGGAGLAVALFAAFSAGITRSILRGEAPDCHCFGQLHSEPAGPKTLARNVLFLGLAVLVVAAGAGTSATAWIGRLSDAGLVGLVSGVVLVLLAAGAGSLVLSLLRRHGRLLLRIEALEEALAGRGIFVPETAPPPPAGLPVGTPAPEFELPDLDGEPVTLSALVNAKPLLLLFTDPGCGPCSALLPQIASWQREHADRLRLVLVTRGDREANLAHAREHGVGDVLLQSDREVSERYEVEGTPAAVLVAADGTIASPVHPGADAITALVSSQTAPAQLQVHHSGPGVGSPAPDVTLRSLDGDETPLSEELSGRTAVLFWNPGSGFCQRMLPDLKRLDESPPPEAPKIVLVSSGDPGANREMQLRAPILLDGNFAAGSAFGATGTPSAVLIDDQGKIASGIAVGAPAVLELMGTNGSSS